MKRFEKPMAGPGWPWLAESCHRKPWQAMVAPWPVVRPALGAPGPALGPLLGTGTVTVREPTGNIISDF